MAARTLGLFLGGLILIVGVWFLRLSGTASTPARPVEATSPMHPTMERETPDPSLHVREMQLRTRLSKSPDDTLHLFQLGILLMEKGDPEEAIPYFQRYIALHPSGRQAYLELARAYATTQAWDRAEIVMRQMLEHFPDDPDALYNLGAILANQGRIEEAQRYWHQVLQQGGEGESYRLARQALRRITGQE